MQKLTLKQSYHPINFGPIMMNLQYLLSPFSKIWSLKQAFINTILFYYFRRHLLQTGLCIHDETWIMP